MYARTWCRYTPMMQYHYSPLISRSRCHGNRCLFADSCSQDTRLQFAPCSNSDTRCLRLVIYSVTPRFIEWPQWFIATRSIPTHDLIHITSSCRAGCMCAKEDIMLSLKWRSSFGNPSPSGTTEGTKLYTNLWVSSIFEYGIPRRLCWAFAHAQTTQHFNRTVSSSLAESLLKTWTSSRGERVAKLIGLWIVWIYKS